MLQNKHVLIYFIASACVYTICFHLEQAFETVLREMKLDSDVVEATLFNLVLF